MSDVFDRWEQWLRALERSRGAAEHSHPGEPPAETDAAEPGDDHHRTLDERPGSRPR